MPEADVSFTVISEWANSYMHSFAKDPTRIDPGRCQKGLKQPVAEAMDKLIESFVPEGIFMDTSTKLPQAMSKDFLPIGFAVARACETCSVENGNH